jgi:hypothetical protein
MPPKTRSARILGSRQKLVYHWRPQKRVSAPSSPNKQPALPRRPLRLRSPTLSGVPAPCDTVKKRPRVRVPGKINPQIISRRPSSHPSEQPPPVTPHPFLAPPPPPAQKKLSGPPALPRCRLARFPLPTPRVPAAHSQTTLYPVCKVFVHLPRRPQGVKRQLERM